MFWLLKVHRVYYHSMSSIMHQKVVEDYVVVLSKFIQIVPYSSKTHINPSLHTKDCLDFLSICYSRRIQYFLRKMFKLDFRKSLEVLGSKWCIKNGNET